jgi:hypothetical protein
VSNERAPLNVLLRSEQTGGAISLVESGSLPEVTTVGPRIGERDLRSSTK